MPTETKIKVVFFDARDTLGEVDSPGHLIPYRPSTEQILTSCREQGLQIGVITNLPGDPTAPPSAAAHGMTDGQGKDMVATAVLSQDPISQKVHTIGDFIPRANVITNKAAKANKPSKEIYQFAAAHLNVSPAECLFIGENQSEVIGALLAGMQAQRKQCPPGRDFAPALVGKIGASVVDSGRQFQALLEHEHLLGERIFACGDVIAARIRKLTDGKTPPLDRGNWISPDKVTIERDLWRAMAYYIHLIDHFADQVHLRAEEAMIEVATACGMDPKKSEWVINQHEQARAYWKCLNVAWKRIVNGDDDDRWYALVDFERSLEAFVYLFKAHAVRENYQLYTEAGGFFNDSDDALVLNILQHSGPSDITPYVGMVERMEALLGLQTPR